MSTDQSPTYGGYASPPDHAQGPPRKKMRKGTKSCMECRRRKIKCTFEPGRTAICNECFARGSTCVDQEHGDVASIAQNSSSGDSTSLRERVSNLEDLIREVLHRLPERPGSHKQDVDSVDTQAAEVLKSLRAPSRSRPSFDETLLLPGNANEAAPALSLFDNAVLSRKQVEPTLSREQYNKAKALNAALLQLLPPLADLEVILESSQEWWTIWRTMFPEITDSRCLTIKESVSHSLRSEKPGEIGKIMLCIAVAIHQLPPYFDWSRLSIKESSEDLMERFVSTVDRLITSDEEIATTIEGIECMVLEAKWQINMGRPKKAWLLHHKAIAYAQLLGLHRVANRGAPKNPDPNFARQLNVWSHLITGDRWLSMMMGLPYMVPESLVGPTLELAKSQTQGRPTDNYLINITAIVGKMIDRNQNPAAAPYKLTLELDQELEDMRNQTDPSWWTTERLPGAPMGKHFERLQAQFFHHHTRMCLHQPFMLRSSADKRYKYSHNATLESAREMIKYYDALRGSDDMGPHACKIIDFQAFMAAMLLLLNLCGYAQASRGAAPQQPDLDQDQHDSTLIDRTVQLLHNAATEAGGIVAAHCAQALGTLAKVRGGKCEGSCKDKDSIQINIPYFGRISITAGKQFVPIKAGTYPDAGSRSSAKQVNSQTGLPTPPSLGSSSTLPSPRDSLMGPENTRPSPYWNSAENIAKGLDQPWTGNDDPFVTFDSFMAFPSVGQIDFSSIGGGPSTTGSSDFLQHSAPFGSTSTIEQQNIAAGFPFPVVSGGNADLDHGWDWFGVGAPAMQ